MASANIVLSIKAVKSGKLAFLPGMGEKKIQNILRGLELWEMSKERMTLLEAYGLGMSILKHFVALIGLYEILELAGSLRRRKE